MEKTIKRTVYDYKDVTSIREGYSINAYEVTVRDGMVISCRGEVKNADNEMFTFSVYEQTKMSEVKRGFMINNVSEDINAQTIIKDFLAFVEEDVKTN